MKGKAPDYYQLEVHCDSDKSAAAEFLTELREWSTSSGKDLLLNTVANPADPVETTHSIDPIYSYMSKFQSELEQICKVPSDRQLTDLKACLTVTPDEQVLIQTHTLLQSRMSDWFTLRKFRITGSIVGRVCNFYKFKKSNPENIARSIFEPSKFSSAAMKYGLECEPTILEHYKEEKGNVTLSKLGLMIDTEHGFLAASPDCGVEENGSLVGIVECKTAVKWSKKTVQECLMDASYPLKTEIVNGNAVVGLKPNYAWYHQIQLQLFVCRSFARFCDLALFHPESKSLHIERFLLDDKWVTKFVPLFEKFFDLYMAPKVISKHSD